MEIAKCDKKLDLAKMSLDKILKVESQADYETTIPENVRLANEEKVCYPIYRLTIGLLMVSMIYRGRHWMQILLISYYLKRCSPS